jgi:3',5'-cyclic AMP phosphodiesterase CpdA
MRIRSRSACGLIEREKMKKKIIQFSDLHLSGQFPRSLENWNICLEIVKSEAPDLVVLSGDFVIDNPDDLDNQRFASEQVQRITAPVLTIPGNHDVGDSVEDPYQGQSITNERRDRFLKLYGRDRWCQDLGDWRLLGINSMLPGSSLEAEAEQYAWMKQETAATDRPVMLFLHKPLCVDDLGEPARPAWAVPPPGRAAIVEAIGESNLRIVASGHLHCHRHIQAAKFDMIWAPTTSIVHQAKVSGVSKTTGWIEYILDGKEVSWTHRTKPDLQAIDVTELLHQYGALRFAPSDALLNV